MWITEGARPIDIPSLVIEYLARECGRTTMIGHRAMRTTAFTRTRRLLLASATGLGLVALASPSWAARCEDLTRLQLPDTTIKSAAPVAAGDAAAFGKTGPTG